MVKTPYAEGWPKTLSTVGMDHGEWHEVVPLSDAERMRKALDEIAISADLIHPDRIGEIAYKAAHPERP